MNTPPSTWPLADACARTSCATQSLTAPADKRILSCVCDGTSRALHAVLRSHVDANPGSAPYVPALWDERVVPLCAVDTSPDAASFLWNGSMPNSLTPRLADVSELVRTIVERLCMNAQEVVVAVVLLDALCVRYGPIIQRYSARPLLLAACILARKLARDADAPTPSCVRALEDHFTALTPELGARIECQLLTYLDWRIPNDPEVYKRHTLGLLKEGTPRNKLPPSIVDVPWLFE